VRPLWVRVEITGDYLPNDASALGSDRGGELGLEARRELRDRCRMRQVGAEFGIGQVS